VSDVSGGALVWGVLESFVDYVRAVGGEVAVVAPASLDPEGRFVFPLSAEDGGAARYGGAVRFEAHGGALALDIVEPWLTAPPDRVLSIAGSRATNSEGERLDFAEVAPDGSTRLSSMATVAFDFRYRSGHPLAPVEIIVGRGQE
jgi:hypothetical protein